MTADAKLVQEVTRRCNELIERLAAENAAAMQKEWDQMSAIIEGIGAGPLPGASAPAGGVGCDHKFPHRIHEDGWQCELCGEVIKPTPTHGADSLKKRLATFGSSGSTEGKTPFKICEEALARIVALEAEVAYEKRCRDANQKAYHEAQAENKRLREALDAMARDKPPEFWSDVLWDARAKLDQVKDR